MKSKRFIFVILALIVISSFTHIILADNGQKFEIQVLNEKIQDKIRLTQKDSSLKFHGLSYGAFRYLGPPNEYIILDNIQEDLEILKRLNVTDIRTYGMNYDQDLICEVAHELGINCATGIWLEPNNTIQQHFQNSFEIKSALDVANISSLLIVGNEALLRGGGMTENKLLDYISLVKSETSTPVTTAEPWNIWLDHPNLADACDVLFTHVYPFWEAIPLEIAATYTIQVFKSVQNAYPDKEVILAEAGWPSSGRADCSEEAQKQYFEDLLPLLIQNDIKSYLFEAFDEAWKINQEGAVGPHWGIFTENRTAKEAAYVFEEYFGGGINPFPPISTSPKDINVIQNEEANISWIITDNNNSTGTYNIYRNGSLISQPDEIWENGTPIIIIIDTSTIGTYDYTIVFSDGISTTSDSVIVSISSTSTTSKSSPGYDFQALIITISFLIIFNSNKRIKRS
ncbi:MAG: glycosyl hydrolase family 17 protein [Promethearchaeota archaeon]